MDFRRTLRLTATALLIGAGPLLPLRHAMAQAMSADADRDAADAAAKAQAKADAKAAAPPPAIPGAVSDEATATSGHASLDMEPTAALFDAINRGDITSAKEALGRGADLNGKNVLDQTPLDMAIDLNRGDITFLLLSMRNSEDGNPVASVATAAAAGRPVKDVVDKHGRHGKAGRTELAKAGHGAASQRFAENGGAPKPEIGFLGFGGS